MGTMSTSSPSINKSLLVLAQALHRLETSGRPVDPDQYRAVVAKLSAELASSKPDATLEAVLQGSPAVAELYENLQYEHASLCRSPLERAVAAELEATQVLQHARRAARRPQ
jgi:hypothetical protein